MKQETFTDIEYSYRKKKTKREEFLEIMEEIIPWDEWVGVIEPYYPCLLYTSVDLHDNINKEPARAPQQELPQ